MICAEALSVFGRMLGSLLITGWFFSLTSRPGLFESDICWTLRINTVRSPDMLQHTHSLGTKCQQRCICLGTQMFLKKFFRTSPLAYKSQSFVSILIQLFLPVNSVKVYHLISSFMSKGQTRIGWYSPLDFCFIFAMISPAVQACSKKTSFTWMLFSPELTLLADWVTHITASSFWC